LNKVRDTILHAGLRLTPLQMAVMMANTSKCDCWLEIVSLLLKTKGIEKNKEASCRLDNGHSFRYALLDCATSFSDSPWAEVVKLILDDAEILSLICVSDMTEGGVRAPLCLVDVINRGNFDILDLFNNQSCKVNEFDPFLSLFVAVELNKPEAFNHLLLRVTNSSKQRLLVEGPKIMKIAKQLGRTEMYHLLKQAGVSEVCEKKAKVFEDDIIEEKNKAGLDYYKKVCWNCLKSADSVSLYKCSGCRKARYCKEKCQEDDWDRHGEYCQLKTKKRELKLQKKNISRIENASEVD